MRSAILLGTVALLVGRAYATVPPQVSVQGVLRNSQGALQSTTAPMIVRFYDSVTTGSGNQYGTSAINLTGVPVVNGLFTVVVSLPADVQAALMSPTSVYVELTVNGEVYPRQPVTSELYALACNQATTAANFSGSLGGDVQGTQSATKVTALQKVPVSSTAPATVGQVLAYNGAQWAPAHPAVAAGSSTATASVTVNSGGVLVASTSVTATGPGVVLVGTGGTVVIAGHVTGTTDELYCSLSATGLSGVAHFGYRNIYAVAAGLPSFNSNVSSGDEMEFPLGFSQFLAVPAAGSYTINLNCATDSGCATSGNCALREPAVQAVFVPTG